MIKIPPLGIMPKYMWKMHVKEKRYYALIEAIERYRKSEFPIDNDWIVEANELASELNKFYERRS